MHKPSNFLKYLELPEDDPERIEFERRQWIGGDDAVCRWQLTVLTGEDLWSKPWAEWWEYLIAFLKKRLPPRSAAACRRYPDQFGRPYIENLRRQRDGERIVGPLTKQDRAFLLLLENPEWTDEQIAEMIPTTLKQLARFSDYKHLRIELRFARDVEGDASKR